ncbi:2-C-methyl-D-erythritol 4-phosphate cytidylyltransferase [Plebeiibacterium marinum]|uniref:2-C-methyl-D-erythritol 4-phosphate cytidylyltransferase n=1 Tax=Plebeiibacterium marinum TaxID=2992111 RepID=A0AAE3MB30_9BACT|nr:2-C-methyl-D-erythritol 4-phosphate cytidylyltransferase [Plebeiobacterium marinum]MCW3804448.1 2-C-methyl-D-erythritol 4-phosphate cytidylyltransferase [Plebeiobacterium marinum]
MKKAVVIVAGGSGSRMNSDIPKQFLELGGKPVLMRTIERFVEYDPAIEIVLVLPKDQVSYWDGLCEKYGFTQSYKLAFGGETRFESVRNGLESLKEECLVGVHDGVRPFVSDQTLDNCYGLALECDSAIPVVDAIESIRILDEGSSKAVDRDLYKMVQTPQVFKCSMLKKSYQEPYQKIFTDDASVFEYFGYPIFLAKGNRENIKLTTPMDLVFGEALIGKL